MASEQVRAPGSKPGENMLWGGRFTGGLDPLMVSYNESIYYDRAFHTQDILGSIAWARANHKNGILTEAEFAAIESGLKQVEEEWVAGTFKIVPGVDEDIHTANERRLGEIIGKEIGGKLHTGRSRNEQVATDMRLWLRDELKKIESFLVDYLKVVAARSENEIEHIMPGYTHLQRAQPIRWSHWMLSYGLAFATDLQRLREVIKRVNRSPLGCGALAGNPFNIDREAMAKELGFEGLLWNSMSAVGDRDFVVETMQWGATLMSHLSRWAEDLIIYGTGEFSFVRLADAYSTGGLPSTYNKDLQESVEPMLDHIKTVGDSIQIATGVLSTLTINPEKMKASLDPFMLATDLADYLVRAGVPFRETHHISGQVVAYSEKTKIPMDQLTYDQLKSIDSRFKEDVSECFDYEKSVEARQAAGGTSKSSVEEQIKVLKSILG
ncbi:hypothetical protein SS1G_03962 [Sclerotinia sclerotiorum 1980 UF-70]|uniref:argininosuccinate lyase n=1 Tax=Sclerotinia sclerotiorum (strain ATCC 18683 / 1980 / Ss-1) TaxID=665079 RepID=A7EF71_SCLS1|nr:hypothetical protein SS1G_03962 [Sclerotinia sclerotiorum 1980 UF-70]EDO01487.1 hypothetical protein SS1G_03962 [Sclerotinia sclerotiorum 1980 UF-70]